jgi:hypothetical protein
MEEVMSGQDIATPETVDSPQNLAERIRDDINEYTNRSIRSLDVSVYEDSVVVSGKTSRYYYKQLTTRAVYGIVSDLNLDNRIEVRVD